MPQSALCCYDNNSQVHDVTSPVIEAKVKNRGLQGFPHRSFLQGSSQRGNIVDRTPHLSNQTLVGDIKATQIQNIVDGLHLLDLDDPGVDRFRGLHQDLFQVVLCPMKNLHKVRDEQQIIKQRSKKGQFTNKDIL